MSIKEKLINKSEVTRRTFLKGVSALGATAALYGCGGGDAGKTYMDEDTTLTPPDITERVVSGSSPHNCGGRCITKVSVKDGVIKRIVTDENPDLNMIDGTGDTPQLRACIKCRSNQQRIYRSDRLMYPLKQTGERGDINGFVRISWDQAISEIHSKLQGVLDQYGAKSVQAHISTGDNAEIWKAGDCVNKLTNLLGGRMPWRSDYSWACMEHSSWFFFGQEHYFAPKKTRQDAFDAESIILCGGNYTETHLGTNTGWYLQQLKEMGKNIVMIDCRVSMTAAGPATININPVPGTDPFLFQSAMYHLITKTWDANGNKIGSYLDEEFILKYVHGFFDDAAYANHPSIQKGYHSDVNRDGTYIVPDGASLSAYVMGTDDRLVKAGLNGAVSVYPDDIGYNNYDTEDATNTQKNALVPVYGQTPKTPEWASEICGVPANSIKEFAELVATTKCHFWIGGGQQRNTEGEQSILNSFTLGVITKNFGVSGTHTGMFSDRKILGFFGLHFPTGSNAQNGYYFTKLYDFSKLTTPISPTTYLPKYSPAVTIGSYPILLWPDVVKNGGSGQSRWNDGQVKRMPATIKAILNFSGNSLTNQCGDYNYVSEVVKEKSDIELIVCSDLYMTASTRFADYILPAAGAFEKDSACSSYYAGDAIIRMHKAVEPMGECKSDFEMCELLADKFGIKSDYNDGMTEKEMVRHIVEPILSANNANMTYEEWEEKGVFRFDESYGITDPFANYRANPASSPLSTPSGKFEVYNQAMVEDYEARGYDNFDTRVTLNGSLHDGSNSGRYVYPIPMCIPILEGKFANDSHPDPMGLDDEYPFGLMSWHSYYRSHSTHFNNAYVNEVYKKDKNGNPAFSNPDRSFSDGVCDTDVYEPVWINPSDAATQGIQNGNRVVVESPRGKIYCSAQITQRIRPGWLGIAEGGNANGDNKSNKPDIGGAINVLTKLNPSRICQGESFSGDNRVKIYQA